jgi:hypothetical protein
MNRCRFKGSREGSGIVMILCPSCQVSILTNRDVGRSIDCRRCSKKLLAEASAKAALREVSERVNETVRARLSTVPRGEDDPDEPEMVFKNGGVYFKD